MNNGVTITIVLSIQFWDSAQYRSFCPLLALSLLNLINADIRYRNKMFSYNVYGSSDMTAIIWQPISMNTKFDEYFFQKLHLSLPLDVITFSEDGNKPSSDEDNKSVSDTDRINNCRRFSILCLQCLLRLPSMQK